MQPLYAYQENRDFFWKDLFSQFGYATFRMTIDLKAIIGSAKYSQHFASQGASRDIFLTNNLEPRPGRVEVQRIHEEWKMR